MYLRSMSIRIKQTTILNSLNRLGRRLGFVLPHVCRSGMDIYAKKVFLRPLLDVNQKLLDIGTFSETVERFAELWKH